VVQQWVSTTAGRHLAGRRKTDTAPERLLRKALHAAGARFRLHRQIDKGCTPDIVLPSRKIAIFVDGCFWHGCPRHGRKKPWVGPNASLWQDKMSRNAERDQRSSTLAEQHGWAVARLRECDIKEDPRGVAAKILRKTVRGAGARGRLSSEG